MWLRRQEVISGVKRQTDRLTLANQPSEHWSILLRPTQTNRYVPSTQFFIFVHWHLSLGQDKKFTDDDGSILRSFIANPLGQRQPRQVNSLRVVVSHFVVRSVDHLLDQGPSDTVTFGAEGHRSLHPQKMNKNRKSTFRPSARPAGVGWA